MTVVFPSKNPRKLAYYLRQAITYIKNNDTDYPKIDYQVKEMPDSVICVRRADGLSFTTIMVEHSESIVEVKSLPEVIGFCVSNENVPRVHFPNYRVTEKDLTILNSWGPSAGYEFEIKNNTLFAKRKS